MANYTITQAKLLIAFSPTKDTNDNYIPPGAVETVWRSYNTACETQAADVDAACDAIIGATVEDQNTDIAAAYEAMQMLDDELAVVGAGHPSSDSQVVPGSGSYRGGGGGHGGHAWLMQRQDPPVAWPVVTFMLDGTQITCKAGVYLLVVPD